MLFILFMKILKAIFSFRLKINVIGKENIPKKGPVIMCFNHTDLLDPAYIPFALNRSMYALVASDHGNNLIVKFFILIGRAMLVDRTSADEKSLSKPLKLLKEGKFLGISPEGTRSKNGILQKGKFGPAYLAGMSDSPILPLGLIGSFGASEAMKDGKVVVTVKVGKPFKLLGAKELVEKLQANPKMDVRDKMVIFRSLRDITNDQIMPKVAELLPEIMRGEFL